METRPKNQQQGKETTPRTPEPRAWESFPKPQGWAMEWHGEDLAHQPPTKRDK